MRKIIFIGTSGMLGSILRYELKNINIIKCNLEIPLNTLIINISGSFIISIFMRLATEILEIDPDIRLAITTGFIGSYTTFSSINNETTKMLSNGSYLLGTLYIILSVVIGLIFVHIGTILSKILIKKLESRKKYN